MLVSRLVSDRAADRTRGAPLNGNTSCFPARTDAIINLLCIVVIRKRQSDRTKVVFYHQDHRISSETPDNTSLIFKALKLAISQA